MSLIDATLGQIKTLDIRRVGILGSPSTLATKLYQNPLEDLGLEVILPSKRELQKIERLIRAVIAGKSYAPLRRQLTGMVGDLLQAGAEVVILGCSELSVIGQGFKNCLDPLDIITDNLIGEK